MKNKGVFGSDLVRKSGGFICGLIGHLQGLFCHVFLGVLDLEIQGGMELRMTHPQQREFRNIQNNRYDYGNVGGHGSTLYLFSLISRLIKNELSTLYAGYFI